MMVGNMASILFPSLQQAQSAGLPMAHEFQVVDEDGFIVPGTGESSSGQRSKWSTEPTVENLYTESYLGIDPQDAYYINEAFSVFIIAASYGYYYLLQRGEHDYFQWMMHLTLWG